MAFQRIDAELHKCETELSAYLGTHNSDVLTRSFTMDGKDYILEMNSRTTRVWIIVNGSKYYYSHVLYNPGCSTEVPWSYVFSDAAFVADFRTYDIRRNRVPESSFIGAYYMVHDDKNLDFDIVTDEFVNTSGGGYTMTRKSRRVRFVKEV
jgi:hypothetical protein